VASRCPEGQHPALAVRPAHDRRSRRLMNSPAVSPTAVLIRIDPAANSRRGRTNPQHIERLGEDAFCEIRPARDSGSRHPWEWACMDLAPDAKRGMRRWLLVRRSPDDPEDLSF
jgi:hypothetical protein